MIGNRWQWWCPYYLRCLAGFDIPPPPDVTVALPSVHSSLSQIYSHTHMGSLRMEHEDTGMVEVSSYSGKMPHKSQLRIKAVEKKLRKESWKITLKSIRKWLLLVCETRDFGLWVGPERFDYFSENIYYIDFCNGTVRNIEMRNFDVPFRGVKVNQSWYSNEKKFNGFRLPVRVFFWRLEIVLGFFIGLTVSLKPLMTQLNGTLLLFHYISLKNCKSVLFCMVVEISVFSICDMYSSCSN